MKYPTGPVWVICPTCDGQGGMGDDCECPDCGGAGHVQMCALSGGKYAIPKERLEAACVAMQARYDEAFYWKLWNLLTESEQRLVREAFIAGLTAALGGEVYPVEAVGVVSTMPQEPAWIGGFNGEPETHITGRTIAILADGQEGDE